MKNVASAAIRIVTMLVLIQLPLKAQSAPKMEIGSKVRVMRVGSSDWESAGWVITLTNDSVVVAGADDPKRPLRVRRDEISRVELSIGQHGNAAQGLGWGLLIGAGTGAIIGYAGGDSRCSGVCPLRTAGEKAVFGGVTLGTIGAAIGVVTGAAHQTDEWIAVSRLAAVAPMADGHGRVGLSIRF